MATYADQNFSAGAGTGSAAVYMAAGAGREPSGVTDAEWGSDQAEQAIAGASSFDVYDPYIFWDVEASGGGGIGNGWSTKYSGPCDTSSGTSENLTAQNVNVFNAYYDSFDNSPFYPAVYSAAGSGQTWSSYFGFKTLSNTAEYTFVNQTSSLSQFPSQWTIPGTSVSAQFFASAPAKCDVVWQ